MTNCECYLLFLVASLLALPAASEELSLLPDAAGGWASAPSLRRWVRDLCRDGDVQPNPGPTFYENYDRVLQKFPPFRREGLGRELAEVDRFAFAELNTSELQPVLRHVVAKGAGYFGIHPDLYNALCTLLEETSRLGPTAAAASSSPAEVHRTASSPPLLLSPYGAGAFTSCAPGPSPGLFSLFSCSGSSAVEFSGNPSIGLRGGGEVGAPASALSLLESRDSFDPLAAFGILSGGRPSQATPPVCSEHWGVVRDQCSLFAAASAAEGKPQPEFSSAPPPNETMARRGAASSIGGASPPLENIEGNAGISDGIDGQREQVPLRAGTNGAAQPPPRRQVRAVVDDKDPLIDEEATSLRTGASAHASRPAQCNPKGLRSSGAPSKAKFCTDPSLSAPYRGSAATIAASSQERTSPPQPLLAPAPSHLPSPAKPLGNPRVFSLPRCVAPAESTPSTHHSPQPDPRPRPGLLGSDWKEPPQPNFRPVGSPTDGAGPCSRDGARDGHRHRRRSPGKEKRSRPKPRRRSRTPAHPSRAGGESHRYSRGSIPSPCRKDDRHEQRKSAE
eukprot:RCo044828